MGSPATDGRVVLLLVEDDTDMRSLLCDELSEMGHRIVEATNAEQALRYVVDHTPTLVLSDLRMAKVTRRLAGGGSATQSMAHKPSI